MGKDAKGHGSNPKGAYATLSRRFDHGELNTPLAKRQGNIDAQLQRYTADQKKSEAVSHKELLAASRARVAEAKELVSRISTDRLKAMGSKHGLSVAETRKMLVKSVESHGERALAVLRKEK